jgi:hypothetical protein
MILFAVFTWVFEKQNIQTVRCCSFELVSKLKTHGFLVALAALLTADSRAATCAGIVTLVATDAAEISPRVHRGSGYNG